MCNTQQFYDKRELTTMSFTKESPKKIVSKSLNGVN